MSSINGISCLNSNILLTNNDKILNKKKEKKDYDDTVIEKSKKEKSDNKTDTKSETNSDIVTKADGSRVLVMTSKIGNMETMVSVELSKPSMWDNAGKMVDNTGKIMDKYEKSNEIENNEINSANGLDFTA